MTKRVFRFTLLFLLALTAIPSHLLAQATASGSVQGTVADSSDAVDQWRAGLHHQPGHRRQAHHHHQRSGSYRFDLIAAGKYKVQVSAKASRPSCRPVELLVGQTVNSTVSLKPGAATQTVEVTGENPLIDTTKTSVSAEITPAKSKNLPMVGRDVANLAYLAPGVKADRLLRSHQEPLRDPVRERLRRTQRQRHRQRRRQQRQHCRRTGDAASP